MVSPHGVVPRRMVSVSASVNLPLHHKVQKFSSGTGSPGWSRKNDRKIVVVCVCVMSESMYFAKFFCCKKYNLVPVVKKLYNVFNLR